MNEPTPSNPESGTRASRDARTSRPAGYQRTGAPGPGSPEYDAMDKLAKMFEAQVEELRGDDAPKQH